MLIEAFQQEQGMIQSFVRSLTGRYGRSGWVERAKADGTVEEMWRELGRGGYLGVTIPEEYGGSGLSMSRLTASRNPMHRSGAGAIEA